MYSFMPLQLHEIVIEGLLYIYLVLIWKYISKNNFHMHIHQLRFNCKLVHVAMMSKHWLFYDIFSSVFHRTKSSNVMPNTTSMRWCQNGHCSDKFHGGTVEYPQKNTNNCLYLLIGYDVSNAIVYISIEKRTYIYDVSE